MTVAAALAGVILLIAAGLTWAARLVHIGNLDMHALADKLATPDPVSALDWPELRIQAVVPQPDGQPLVLLRVSRPAHPRQSVTLLVALDRREQQSLPVLSPWYAQQHRSHLSARKARDWNSAAGACSGCTRYWSPRTPHPYD